MIAQPGGDRRPAAWPLVLGAIVVAGAALRFATLGVQSYTHEEAVTVGRVLHAGLLDTLSAIPSSESTPPAYYVLAWIWSKPFGTGEVWMRSLSALAGTAAIPVAFLAARSLVSERAGLASAGIVAASPMLIWYSQLARSYALLTLLSACSFLLTIRALQGGSHRTMVGWAAVSALALATHYFAAFLIVPEVALLLARRRDRAALLAVAAVGLAAMLLAPLAIHQTGISNNDWISNESLGRRLADVPRKFLVGETGAYIQVYGAGANSTYLNRAALPGALVLVGIGLLIAVGSGRERSGAKLALLLGGSAALLPVVLALLGADYLLARNLLPAYGPLAVVIGAGFGAERAGRAGAVAAGTLCAILAAFAVYTMVRPALRHDDWRGLARAIGPPSGQRAIVAPFLADDPLVHYLDRGIHRASASRVRLNEIVIAGYGPPSPDARLPRGFRLDGSERAGYFTVTRYVARGRPFVRADLLDQRELVGAKQAAVLVDRGGVR